jgi:lipopolysaccharide/colanic/teichoic acid biosynthesis glycosyltransferase
MRVDPFFQTTVTTDHDPRITGPATLKYRDEEALLAAQDDPERYNNEVLWPDKVRLNRQYVENWSFWGDIRLILKTGKII